MKTVLMKESPELEEKLGAWIILILFMYTFLAPLYLGAHVKKEFSLLFAFPRKPIATNQTWRGLLMLEV
jgi:hypothetical protein